MTSALPWLVVLALLTVAYGLDRWLESARGMTGAGMGVSSFQWLIMAANLVFAACALTFAWLLFTRRDQHRALAVICVGLGVTILLLPTPPFWALGMRLPSLLVPLLRASPFSLFGHAGAVLTVAGLAALLAPVRLAAPPTDQGSLD